MKTIKIFLASSGELKEEREKIALFIAQENKILVKEELFLELVVWEYLLHSFTNERIQNYFNEEMIKCDIVIALFYKQVGQFTKEEFDLAYDNFKKGNQIKNIFVFFKDDHISISEVSEDLLEVIKFKREIENFKQIYNTFDSIESLINKIKKQLDLILKNSKYGKEESKLKARRVDAAVSDSATKGEQIDLLVQVRFPESPILGIENWPTKQKPDSIEQTSDKIKLEFPLNKKTGNLNSAYLKIQISTSDFEIQGPSNKHIEVPPDQYSKIIMFYLKTIKTGFCRINIELYTIDKEIYLGAIPIETTVSKTSTEPSGFMVGQLFLNVQVADGYFNKKSTSKKINMVMQRCKDGLHFYDTDKHSSCPYCRDQGLTIDSTKAIDFNDDENGSTVAVNSLSPSTITQAITTSDSDFSIAIFRKKTDFEPVVGWLVCTEGSVKGKDFKIKPGINEVGRDDTQDVEIVITGDQSISRRNHAEIEYDSEENAFYLMRKKSQAVKLNGKSVRQPTLLNSHDIIQFGETVFIFVPLCNENFKWVIDS